MRINTLDIDGIIDQGGFCLSKDDIIITGRSYEEAEEISKLMIRKKINNRIFYNPIELKNKTRENSAQHKVIILSSLISQGYNVETHFDVDEIQVEIIKKLCPSVKVVLLIQK